MEITLALHSLAFLLAFLTIRYMSQRISELEKELAVEWAIKLRFVDSIGIAGFHSLDDPRITPKVQEKLDELIWEMASESNKEDKH